MILSFRVEENMTTILKKQNDYSEVDLIFTLSTKSLIIKRSIEMPSKDYMKIIESEQECSGELNPSGKLDKPLQEISMPVS